MNDDDTPMVARDLLRTWLEIDDPAHSVAALAAALGVTRQTIYYWLTCTHPRPEYLDAIERVTEGWVPVDCWIRPGWERTPAGMALLRRAGL